MLTRRGIDKATEEQIAQAANDLLDRAEKGPGRPATEAPQHASAQPRQDLRAAARTRATTSEDTRAAWPRRVLQEPAGTPQLSGPGELDEEPDDEDRVEGDLAKVIPLSVFDAAEEAKKRW